MNDSTSNSENTQQLRAPHLLEEPPILVYPTLAVYMGINKAVVFQQLHFLQNNQKTAKNEHNFVDDRYWVYNSYQQWKDQYFPWLSISTLKGIFIELEDDDKLIISRQSVKNKSDRRKWYTIDYEAWVTFCTTMRQKMSDGSLDKKCPTKKQKLSDGYSETSSETSSKTSSERKKTKTIHPLIQIWAAARKIDQINIGAAIHTSKDLACAKRLAKWEIPPTEEEIQSSIQVSKRSKDYAFQWLEEDIPKLRIARLPKPTPIVTAPPPPAEREVPLTPEQAAERQAEYERIMAELTAKLVSKTVAAA